MTPDPAGRCDGAMDDPRPKNAGTRGDKYATDRKEKTAETVTASERSEGPALKTSCGRPFEVYGVAQSLELADQAVGLFLRGPGVFEVRRAQVRVGLGEVG